MFSHKNLTILAVLATGAAATTGVALAGAAAAPAVQAPVSAVPAAVLEQTLPDPVASVEPEARKAFAAFRNVPATSMPADVAEQVGSSTRFGRNPKLARSIDTTSGKGWLIPGRGYVCIAVPDPIDGWGTSCSPTAVAAVDGLKIGLGGPSFGGRVALTVVAPDGTTTVQKTASGATLSVKAQDGVTSKVVDSLSTLNVTTP